MNLNWHKIKTVIGLIIGYVLVDVTKAYPDGLHWLGVSFEWTTVMLVLTALGIADAARDPIPDKYLPKGLKTNGGAEKGGDNVPTN